MTTTPPWTNLRFRFLFADETSVLGITSAGDLMRYPHWANPAAAPRPTTDGQKIGNGWAEFTDVFSGGNGVIYAIAADGGLHWYQYAMVLGAVIWTAGSGNQIGQGWQNFKWVVSGGGGIIYAVTSLGDLLWYRDQRCNGTNAPNGSSGWDANSASKIGRGWHVFRHVVSGGGGVIYAVDADGALRWYRDDLIDGTNGDPPVRGWAPASGSQVGTGWQYFLHVFAGGPGQIFAAQALDFGPWIACYIDAHRDGTANGWTTVADAWVQRADATFSGGWQVAKTEGYCWPISIEPGQTATFFVSSMNQGAGAAEIVRLTGRGPALGTPVDPPTGRLFATGFHPDNGYSADCAWPAAFDLTLGNVPAGFYAARVQGPSGPPCDIPFVLRRGPVRGNIAVMVNVNTWNAYNFWGGQSNYSATGEYVTLTHKRPNHHLLTCSVDHIKGNHLIRSEIWLVDWLQQHGYTIELLTDLDLHDGADLSAYKAVIVGSHSEYWTPQMMDRIRASLDAGGSLLNLSGNIAYRPTQIWAQAGGGSDLMRTAYLGMPTGAFPAYGDKPLFAVRQDLTGAPGPGQGYAVVPGRGFVPANAPITPVGATGWNGPPVGGATPWGASGWESDIWTDLPADALLLGQDPGPDGAVIASYRTARGGFVLGVGSITFVGALATDPTLTAIVQNALADALAR